MGEPIYGGHRFINIWRDAYKPGLYRYRYQVRRINRNKNLGVFKHWRELDGTGVICTPTGGHLPPHYITYASLPTLLRNYTLKGSGQNTTLLVPIVVKFEWAILIFLHHWFSPISLQVGLKRRRCRFIVLNTHSIESIPQIVPASGVANLISIF